MHKAIGLLLFVILALTGNVAIAQTFPVLTGRVVDEANLLNPAQEATLTAKLEGLETRTKRQLVVVTLNSLQGYEISDYGYRLGRHWAIGQDGIGETEKDNGTLLIVAPNERKMRIEVGYGLEPILTDGFSSTVIRKHITPYFEAGDLPGGINAGVDQIVTQLELPPEEAAKIAAEMNKPRTKQSDGPGVGALIFWLFVLIFVILPMFRGLRGKKHRSRGSHGPIIIWGGGSGWGGGGSGGSSWGGGGFGGGGFGGGGGGFGGGGASGGW